MLPSKQPLTSYTHHLRSRYGETDKMGYVYYGRYLEYFEVARTEMIRDSGFSYHNLEESGVMLPVIHSEIQYKEPVFYDELMEITVSVYDVPTVRLITYYEIHTQNRTKLHTLGSVTLCFMDMSTRRPVRAPQAFLDHVMKPGHRSNSSEI
jgi:acyl-CoA thioester hydrolase